LDENVTKGTLKCFAGHFQFENLVGNMTAETTFFGEYTPKSQALPNHHRSHQVPSTSFLSGVQNSFTNSLVQKEWTTEALPRPE
jgi:hypothetical protein